MNFLTGFLFSFLVLLLSQGIQLQSSVQTMAISFLAAVSTKVVVATNRNEHGWLALFALPPLLLINDALADLGIAIRPIVLLGLVVAISLAFIHGMLVKRRKLLLTALLFISTASLVFGWWLGDGLLVMLSVFGYAYFVNQLITGRLVDYLAKKNSFTVGLSLLLFVVLAVSHSFGFSVPSTLGMNQQQFSDSVILDLIFKSSTTLIIVVTTVLLFEIFASTILEKFKEDKSKTVNPIFIVISLVLLISISHLVQLIAPVSLGSLSLVTASLFGAAAAWLISNWLRHLSHKLKLWSLIQRNQAGVVAVVAVVAYLLTAIPLASKTAESLLSFEQPSIADLNKEINNLETPQQRFLIAHAGGGYKLTSYSNSVNALEANLDNFDYFELDLQMTSDGGFVCIHDWGNSSEKQLGRSFDQPPTLDEFRLLEDSIDFSRNCDEDLIETWLIANPDKKIVTDGKGDSIRILERISSRYPSITSQVVPQVYFPDELAHARALGFQEIILTLYKWMPQASGLSNFLKSSGEGLFAVTFPKSSSGDYTEVVHSFGIPACVHPVNDEAEAKQFFDSGINCLYTSFITSVP